MVITTWFLDSSIPALVRKDKEGNIREQKSLQEADGYRCYSRADDEAWRSSYAQLSACCKK